MGVVEIIEVRNSDNKLVATIDGDTQTIIIIRRDYETRIVLHASGVEIKNKRISRK